MKKFWLVACALVVCASTAGADVVVDWNIQAGQSIAAGGRRGPSGIFDFAMVHAAVHDAVQAFEGRFEPYCAAIPDASGSPIAAAAAAAHGVLIALFPAQTTALNTAFDASLAKYGLTGDAGVLVGHYTRCSDAARDVVDARIYEGIHFRFADTVAFRQGKHVANWAFGHFMRPIVDDHD